MTTKQFQDSVTDSIKNLVNKANQEDNDDLERWVATTLANDESSTDGELVEHFTEGGPMPTAQANFYISQRNEALRSPLHFSLKPYKAKVPDSFEDWLASNSDSIEMPLDRTEATAQWFDDKAKNERPF